ncbi:MAG: ABC transporter ATP-binding protein [Hominimerdicola sp.]
MNVVEVKNVTKKYKTFTLENINLDLPQGCIMGLVGENGAGKSTLIKLIMDAINRDGGEITVLGCDNKSRAFVQTKQDIGVVLDEAFFPETVTIKQINNIMKCTYTNWDEKLFLEYVERFNLKGKKRFKDFSRGMKMKLAIAVALSHNPKLLILDEATSGLDPMIRDEILDVFNDFTRDETHSIIMSSHIVSDLEKICDYIAFIHKGKLVVCEEKDRLLEEYAIVKMSQEDFSAVPPDAVKSKKEGKFGVEALVEKSKISDAFVTEHTNLEDIILFLAKGENK